MTTQTHPNIQFSDRLRAAASAHDADQIDAINAEMIRCGARDPVERDEWVPPSSRVPRYEDAFDLGRSVLGAARSRGLVGA